MIMITGATGPLGKAATEALLKKTSPSTIAVLARAPAKAADLASQGVTVRQGDYDDYDSLVKAFQGVDKLYFVSGSDITRRMKQHENIIKAAKEAGVKHVVYTSFQRKDESGDSPIAMVAQSHIKTEELLKESGLTYTIMKHTLYTDMIPVFAGEKVLETGTIFLPTGDGKVAYATRTDMGEAGANVLSTDGHENKVYEIAGGTAVSNEEIASMISEITGKKITHVSPDPEVYQQTLAQAGVPAEYIGVFTSFSAAIKVGTFDNTDNTLEKLLGRKSVSVKEFLKGIYSAN